MSRSRYGLALLFVLTWTLSPVSRAADHRECVGGPRPAISFVEFPSFDPQRGPLTIKAKLKQPVRFSWRKRCFVLRAHAPAVVIFHGSSGVDSRGDFYARALNAVGIATLEPDMWEARGVRTIEDRNFLPISTHPDAFAALAFLSATPRIDPARIGILGFSWGGVMSLAAAEELYAGLFGGGLRFAAHVAHYPVCYGANNASILQAFGVTPAQAGIQFLDVTGAPVLIQIGTEDDYDNGIGNCLALRDMLVDPVDRATIQVVPYEGVTHAWDRLQVPFVLRDPFADEGRFLTGQVPLPPAVNIVPDVEQAYTSRRKAVAFFLRNL